MKNYFPQSHAKLLKEHPLNRELELEAAMCAWEHLMTRDWEHGAGMLRMCAGAVASAIHYGYIICTKGNTEEYQYGAYDWDFVPWFVDTCVILDNEQAYAYGTPDLVPDWVTLCIQRNQPTAEDLLSEARQLLNSIPNQGERYHLAAKIDDYFKTAYPAQ